MRVRLFCRCICFQSNNEYNGEVVHEKSGDVVLNLLYITTIKPSVPPQHNDEVVIKDSTNSGTHPELIYNTSNNIY